MWNCSTPPSLLLPFGDDYRESLGSSYTVQCEGSSSRAGAVGLESGQHSSLQAPMLFPMHGSHGYLLGGMGGSSIYNCETSLAFGHQFDCIPPTAATHPMKWTTTGETVTVDGSRLIRGSKRLKTTTAQGPHRGLRRNAKPRNQPAKQEPPCKRSQKLGDKITALQRLVSPYGRTDTASVLQEDATCIKHLHQQILDPAAEEDDEEEGAAMDLRRRGLCLAPLSPAVEELVSSGTTRGHNGMADTGGCWRQLGTLL